MIQAEQLPGPKKQKVLPPCLFPKTRTQRHHDLIISAAISDSLV
jgi:hypothetical protein